MGIKRVHIVCLCVGLPGFWAAGPSASNMSMVGDRAGHPDQLWELLVAQGLGNSGAGHVVVPVSPQLVNQSWHEGGPMGFGKPLLWRYPSLLQALLLRQHRQVARGASADGAGTQPELLGCGVSGQKITDSLCKALLISLELLPHKG